LRLYDCLLVFIASIDHIIIIVFNSRIIDRLRRYGHMLYCSFKILVTSDAKKFPSHLYDMRAYDNCDNRLHIYERVIRKEKLTLSFYVTP